MGRVTYQEMAGVWPTSTSEYAAPMNEIPKVVFSKTLQSADWADSRIARGDLADEIARLKREPGRDLIDPLHLELIEAHRYTTGAVGHVYRPRGR
jgi:dihydrofolate reductase